MDIEARTGGGRAVVDLGRLSETAVSPRGADGKLASLPDGVLSSRFCAWRGASERRYVASVYAVDHDATDVGLPAFEGFVLMAVAREPLGRRILAVSSIERTGDRNAALARGLAQGAQEWHVHFLAEDRREREAMVADLRARHGDAAGALCA